MTLTEFFNKLTTLKFKVVSEKDYVTGESEDTIRELRTKCCPLSAVARAEGHNVGQLNYISAAKFLKIKQELAREIALAADFKTITEEHFPDENIDKIIKLRKKLEKACL